MMDVILEFATPVGMFYAEDENLKKPISVAYQLYLLFYDFLIFMVRSGTGSGQLIGFGSDQKGSDLTGSGSATLGIRFK